MSISPETLRDFFGQHGKLLAQVTTILGDRKSYREGYDWKKGITMLCAQSDCWIDVSKVVLAVAREDTPGELWLHEAASAFTAPATKEFFLGAVLGMFQAGLWSDQSQINESRYKDTESALFQRLPDIIFCGATNFTEVIPCSRYEGELSNAVHAWVKGSNLRTQPQRECRRNGVKQILESVQWRLGTGGSEVFCPLGRVISQNLLHAYFASLTLRSQLKLATSDALVTQR